MCNYFCQNKEWMSKWDICAMLAKMIGPNMVVHPNRESEKLIKETICKLWLLCLDSVGEVPIIVRWLMNKCNHYIKIKSQKCYLWTIANLSPLRLCSIYVSSWTRRPAGASLQKDSELPAGTVHSDERRATPQPYIFSVWSRTKFRMSWEKIFHLSRIITEKKLVRIGTKP